MRTSTNSSTWRMIIQPLAVLVIVAAAVFLLPSWTMAAAPGAGAKMRMPWKRATGEYLRTWLLCGEFPIPPDEDDFTLAPLLSVGLENDYLQGHGGEAAIRPVAGMTHKRPDGSPAAWRSYTAKSDIVDLDYAFAGRPTEYVVGYAYTTIHRTRIGKAVLSVGSDDGVKVWLNGKVVHDHLVSRGVRRDDDLIVVSLNAGENALLVKTAQAIDNWGFCFRVLEMAEGQAIEMTSSKLSPSIISGEGAAPDKLIILTDGSRSNLLPIKPPVTVEVLAAGSKPVARATAARGERVAFPSTVWADGIYTVRCAMTGMNGRRVVSRLLWYKGDALASVQRLVETAPPAADAKSPAGTIHAMLAALVTDRVGKDLTKVKPKQLPGLYSALLEFACLPQAGTASGQARGEGLVRFAYRDPVDDSPQFCRAYLPHNYTPAKKWPVVVLLHGRANDFPPYYRWGIDGQYDGFADQYHVITVYPHGRGNAWFRGIGDMDVTRCVELAKANFAVDTSRIYLMGYSMGGAGTWYAGTRHPEIFAALAPVFGGYDYRFQLDEDDLAKMTAKEQYRRERISYIAQLESLLTTPVLANHGETDPIVPVEYSRYTTHLLARWGYEVRYWEHPNRGHEGLGNEDAVMEWLLARRLVSNPKHVRLHAAELRTAAAHWVKIEGRDDPYAFMEADAEVIAPNLIRLDTQNVLQVRLSPQPPLIDPAKPLQISWNGVDFRVVAYDPNGMVLRARGFAPEPNALCKRPGVEGPIGDVYQTPFLIVVGTASPDPLMRAMCARAAQRLVTGWEERYRCPPRCRFDIEMSPDDYAGYSLVLIGGPQENLVTRELADRLPLVISKEGFEIDGRKVAAADAAVQMVYPNPANPDRYVLVMAATSPAGMYYADYAAHDLDFCIVDARGADPRLTSGSFDVPGEVRLQHFLFGGYFDNAWRFKEAFTETGDAALRAAVPLWKTPRYASADVPGNLLNLCEVVESASSGPFRRMVRDLNAQGERLTLARKRYASGIALGLSYAIPKEPGTVDYALAGMGWKRLRGTIGIEVNDPKKTTAARKENTRVEFIVRGDGKELYHSPVFRYDAKPLLLDVNIAGVHTLQLEARNVTTGPTAVRSVDWAEMVLARE
ncbi:MAG: NPCBM/NEW2 domain-containing protein [Armatimonadota bacterium]